MSDVTPPTTESRKVDHIKINLERDVQFPRLTTGLENLRLLHNAVPELDLADVDPSLTLFGKRLSAPILVSSMTGGTGMASTINRNLAAVADRHGLAMGVGSQRAAVEDPALAESYKIRPVAPNLLLFANIGAVQFNYGYGVDLCRRAVDMIEADALILHFNVLQEAVQPEGDTNFSGLLDKVAEVVSHIGVPVIAKEVGWGFSEQNVRDLASAGVAAIDVAGAGGTSWSQVERFRAPSRYHEDVASAFEDWGITTVEALKYARLGAPQIPAFASGGLRTGVDIAKCIALGASLGGIAGQFLRAATDSEDAVEHVVSVLTAQLRIAMQCTGSRTLDDLRRVPLIEGAHA
ncbi:MAG: type 2 isopentenyl-diphosphate Delta-isomerase [Chloroflexi bacterium]|jgi:isopentenyl-diphosphate delta-isomerase|nr:MAG: isopentenyl-diphosphate delta-isomerase [Chloroflexi bacterium OLB13]MBC6956476.1 type 2 isopentenyl-diphosphate Delta-isomerase [Chloroflexota bacterium]MBV6435795.1 Isopentenyl-diphosphate delta-isomerase [Anaerolineae bacterium]MDL1916004.1 type 2 isopentenyl-diphosphate Delta-isomerase [Anaerolineae bacterium CFX4]OQY84433.1 MAG: type 2 isopentenyl-diphosphate Delta-isomerase [Anaerolineae bacterium UTCFX5]